MDCGHSGFFPLSLFAVTFLVSLLSFKKWLTKPLRIKNFNTTFSSPFSLLIKSSCFLMIWPLTFKIDPEFSYISPLSVTISLVQACNVVHISRATSSSLISLPWAWCTHPRLRCPSLLDKGIWYVSSCLPHPCPAPLPQARKTGAHSVSYSSFHLF